MNPLPLSPSIESAIQSKIRKIGKIGRFICSCLLVISAPIIFIYFLLISISSLQTIPSGMIYRATVELGGPAFHYSGPAVGGLFIIGVMGIFMLGGLWIMRSLFVQFTRDEIFTQRTARLIKWIGILDLLSGCNHDLFLLLSGLFLLAFGWVMELAVSLKQEQDFTV